METTRESRIVGMAIPAAMTAAADESYANAEKRVEKPDTMETIISTAKTTTI